MRLEKDWRLFSREIEERLKRDWQEAVKYAHRTVFELGKRAVQVGDTQWLEQHAFEEHRHI